jgi:hypothetical protein
MSQAGAAGSTSACAGAAYQSVCWYLGALEESCDVVCSSHGGVDADGAALVGTAAQGGSVEDCRAILGLLGVELTVKSGARTDGRGVGCHIWSGEAWWLRSPDFSSTASSDKAQVACGCEE